MRKAILRCFTLILFISLTLATSLGCVYQSRTMLREREREMLYDVKLIFYAVDFDGDLTSQIDEINPLAYDDNTRISIISEEGVVLADTYNVDVSENHKDREEVQEALNNADHIGYAVRKSESTKENTLYVAVLQDGYIVRLSVPYNGLYDYMITMVPGMIVIMIVAFALSYVLALVLARRINKPVSEIARALDDMSDDYRFNFPPQEYEEFNTIVDTLENLTHRLRKSMDETKEEKVRIDEIISAMREGFVMMDEDNRVILVNPSAIEILGDLKEKDVFTDQINDPVILETLNNGESRCEIERDGMYYRCYVSRVSTGKAIILADITAQKNATHMREEFFASLSHELKTPITSVRGYSELLSSGMITGEENTKKTLEKIDAQVRHMDSLINDILLISRFDSDDIVQSIDSMHMPTMVKDVLADYETQILEEHLTVETDVGDFVYIGYNQQLRTLISNLVSNSIRYNVEGGKVIVRVKKKDDNLWLQVEDTGIGIAPGDQTRVFERFFRVDKARSRAKGGTGLGLSIVKHTVAYAKGTIDLKSRPGQGTCMTITLPFKNTPTSKAGA